MRFFNFSVSVCLCSIKTALCSLTRKTIRFRLTIRRRSITLQRYLPVGIFAACRQRVRTLLLGTQNYKDPMLLTQTNHNVEAKTLLNYPGAVNQNIAANVNGNTELQLALDNIFNHPNLAPFVSRLFNSASCDKRSDTGFCRSRRGSIQ